MQEPDTGTALPKRKQYALPLLSAGILVMGLAAAWWFHQREQPPVVHAETTLFRQIEEPRILLADIFRSYDSETLVATALEAAGLQLQRKVQERPQDARYPPRRMTSFTVFGYRHLDSEGTLVLEFFNDRLMEVDFRPDDPVRYAPRLRSAFPALQSTGTGHAEQVAAPLRIWSSVELARSKVGKSLGSSGVVLWQDLRLIAQRDDWDARYGHIPIPFEK